MIISFFVGRIGTNYLVIRRELVELRRIRRELVEHLLNCFWPAEKLFKSQGCTVHRYSEYIIEEDIKTAKNITF